MYVLVERKGGGKKKALIFKEVKKGEYNSTNSWH